MFSCIISAQAGTFSYTLTGPVAGVFHQGLKRDDASICYIAVTDDNFSNNYSGYTPSRSNYYHWTKNLEHCAFAERAKALGMNVKMYGKHESHNDYCAAIEYANTPAKFFYIGDAFE